MCLEGDTNAKGIHLKSCFNRSVGVFVPVRNHLEPGYSISDKYRSMQPAYIPDTAFRMFQSMQEPSPFTPRLRKLFTLACPVTNSYCPHLLPQRRAVTQLNVNQQRAGASLSFANFYSNEHNFITRATKF